MEPTLAAEKKKDELGDEELDLIERELELSVEPEPEPKPQPELELESGPKEAAGGKPAKAVEEEQKKGNETVLDFIEVEGN
jgi:hypothetical protein